MGTFLNNIFPKIYIIEDFCIFYVLSILSYVIVFTLLKGDNSRFIVILYTVYCIPHTISHILNNICSNP